MFFLGQFIFGVLILDTLPKVSLQFSGLFFVCRAEKQSGCTLIFCSGTATEKNSRQLPVLALRLLLYHAGIHAVIFYQFFRCAFFRYGSF